MPVSRVHRLIRLITLLQGGRPRSAVELGVELGVSKRTLFRDLNLLEAAGVPYYHDRPRGYRIRESFFLPPINLSVSETLGLMLLGKTAEADRSRPLVPAALSAIHKLIATVPEPIREACGDLASYLSVDPGSHTDGNEESRVYADLQRGIDERRACEVTYQPPTDETPLRCRLMPYALHLANNAWYVLGRTDAHGKEVRVLKLVRFREVTLTDARFRRPADFKVSDKLGRAWRLNPEGKEYDVEAEFSPKVATNVSEVRWHATQRTTLLDDGRCRLKFRVDGLHEIAWWLCGYAEQVTVLKPAELRRQVAAMHRRAAAVNEG